MPELPPAVTACVFDMDGVLTQTADVHYRAWADTFLDVLAMNLTEADYLAHVDGRARRDGVRSFLAAQGIELPEGDPDDSPSERTIAGIANLKNERLVERLQRDGVDAFPGSVRYVEAVRGSGMRTAVVTASAHAHEVLEAAGIAHLFEVVVDGVVAARDGLAGKPAPDTFLAAADQLGVPPTAAAVFEDSLAGVEAGRAGGFGYVVGVDRAGQADELRQHGADTVVTDLADLLDAR